MQPIVAMEAAELALVLGVALLALGIAIATRAPGLVTGRPWTVLAALGLASALAAGALFDLAPPRLSLALDPSTEPLLPAGDPARPFYEQAVREFGDDELYAIAMETDDGVFTRERLLALEAVHRGIARLPGVRHVQSLVDVVTFRYDPAEDWIDVGRLFDAVPETEAEIAALRERALGDPLLRRTVVSEDGRTAGLSVRFVETTDREFIESRLDERISELLAAAERPGLRFHVAGRPHAKASVYRGMVRDLRVLIPLAVAVLAVVLTLATGSRRGVVLPLANVLVANLWTFAAMAAMGRPITILSSMLGPELIAIGGVFGVHVVAGFDEERRGAGDARTIAARTLAHERMPIAIAAATTQIGFGSLCLSNVPAVVEFGAFAVLGVGCVAFLAMTALPATLALLPARRERSALPPLLARASSRFDRLLARALAAVNAASARRPVRCIAAGAVAAIASALAIPHIEIDTDYLSFFDEDSAVRRDFDALNQLLAGAIPIYVVLSGSGPGTFREPEALRALEALQARAATLPGVSHTVSLVDTLRAMNRAVEGGDPAAERIPDQRAAVTELLQLAPKDEMQRFVNVNASRANLWVRTGSVGSASIDRLERDLRAAAAETLPAGLSAEPTGNAILLARTVDGIAAGQVQSVGAAATAIFVLVTVSLRSLRLGVIAMIPNLLPVAMYFGLLGLGAAPLSLPTSLIGAVALGIAIDDTVHFLVRYQRERRAGASPGEAARVTGLRVGTPIATTALMLSAGFGVIALSEFATLREFGTLFAATVVFCLAAELVLMPALLVRLRA
jgi:hydrophobe/amphiphile efflux-3 (HAE3) family protein